MKALITAPYNDAGLHILKEYFDTLHYHSWKMKNRAFRPDELIEMLQNGEYDVFITEHVEVDKSVIDACPTLKVIGVCRGTPSNEDVSYAKQRNIKVLNTPGRNAQAVAELFIGNYVRLYQRN